ncbi:MAG: PEGA domain-containing protein [Pirellulales bacterium]
MPAPTKLRHNHRRLLSAWLLIAMLLPAAGCVRRRLNVRTNPPGALVYVDNQQIGTTPCSVDFTYYGTREIRLIKPGYETLTVNQPIPTPWYQYPGLDFISENLVATKIRDNRTVTYDLAPQVIVPTEQLIGRGNQLRQDALQYPVAPAGATIPAAGPPVAPGVPVGPAVPVGPPIPAGAAPPTFSPAPAAAPLVAPPSTEPQRLPAP